jgi:hypothetical protein
MFLNNIIQKFKNKEHTYICHQSIDTLPIACFFKIIETGDLRYLLRLQDYSKLPENIYDLHKEWLMFKKQYAQETKDIGFILVNDIQIDIYILIGRYTFIKNAIVALAIKEDQEIINIVRKWYKFEYHNQDEYYNAIINLQHQLEGIRKRIQLKQHEIIKLTKGESITEINIYDIMAPLEKHFGFRINPWEMSVKEFLSKKKILQQPYTKNKIHA